MVGACIQGFISYIQKGESSWRASSAFRVSYLVPRKETATEEPQAHSRFHILYPERKEQLMSPKSHLASFEEQALLPKLAWSNPIPCGEQGIWLWWVKSCNSADFQKALRDIRVQIWWKGNETFTPKSLRSFWNFTQLSSKYSLFRHKPWQFAWVILCRD